MLKATTQILSESDLRPSLISHEMVEQINTLKNPPPSGLKASELFVRRCRLAGDMTDGHQGKFRTEDLPKLLSMVHGIPLLVGHQKNQAPIGRFFGGSVESQLQEPENPSFIVPNFYWPISASYANDLRVLIDSGVYNEASISFAFGKPTCGICGKDIRGCDHRVKLWARDPDIFYFYDNLITVLEGSIVYKGAEPGTGFEL